MMTYKEWRKTVARLLGVKRLPATVWTTKGAWEAGISAMTAALGIAEETGVRA